MLVGHGGPDLPDSERLVGEFVQDVLDGADSGCRPGSPFARRRRGGFGEGLADHAPVDVVTGGELADGHAEGGVVADDAEQPGFAVCLGFCGRRGRQVAPAGGGEAGEGEGAVRALPLTAASRRSLIDPVGTSGLRT